MKRLLVGLLFVVTCGCATPPMARTAPPLAVVSDYEIQDTETGLVWARRVSSPGKKKNVDTLADLSGRNLDYDEAQAFVAKLNSSNYAGHSDWRLPVAGEFKRLILMAGDFTKDFATCNSCGYVVLDKVGFLGANGYFWTQTVSTPSPDGDQASDKVWVAFTGDTLGVKSRMLTEHGKEYTGLMHVWPVRGNIVAQDYEPRSNEPTPTPSQTSKKRKKSL